MIPKSDNRKPRKFVKNKKPMKKEKVQKGKANKERVKKAKLHRAYYQAAHVLQQLSNGGCTINHLMEQFKKEKYLKMLYALAVKVLKNQEIIKEIRTALPEPPSELNTFIVDILIGELLFGEKSFFKYRVKGEVKYVSENANQITEQFAKVKAKTLPSDSTNARKFLRYIRINNLKTSKEEVMTKLCEMGFREKSFQGKEISFDKFKELAKDLADDEYLQDYHFDDILVLNDNQTKKLADSNLCTDGFIAMQDKASLLAIEAMSLCPGMTILDACAAPGMKTAAIASRLNNDCRLIANDSDKKRYASMKPLLQRLSVQFVESLSDFTKLDPTVNQDLDVILLDPSCTGSGINRRLDYRSEEAKKEDEIKIARRCEKLAKFQLTMLQAALQFRPKRIVYCTCSLYQTENEDVINSLMQLESNLEYQVVDPLPTWPFRGVGDYDWSRCCLRADYETTLTNGFFCCVLERNDLQSEKQLGVSKEETNQSQVQEHLTSEISKGKKKKRKNLAHEIPEVVAEKPMMAKLESETNKEAKKKIKRETLKQEVFEEEHTIAQPELQETEVPKRKKKNKRKDIEAGEPEKAIVHPEMNGGKRKRKKSNIG